MSDEMKWGQEPREAVDYDSVSSDTAQNNWDPVSGTQTALSKELEELKGADIPWLNQIPEMNQRARENQEVRQTRILQETETQADRRSEETSRETAAEGSATSSSELGTPDPDWFRWRKWTGSAAICTL